LIFAPTPLESLSFNINGNTMDELNTLPTTGLTLPSPAYLAGTLIFGIIGYIGFRYGQKTASLTTKWLGISLMLYPFAIAETWQIYAVGCALSLGLYYNWRNNGD
jgi:hypothetical protein